MALRKFRPHDPDAPTPERAKAVMVGILSNLPRRERGALIGFYCDEKSAEEIQSTLGIGSEEFRELRRSTKAAFLERIAVASQWDSMIL